MGGLGFFDSSAIGDLCPLTVIKHRASVSRVTWEQIALASLMDSAVSDSF